MALHAYSMHTSLRHVVELPVHIASFAECMKGVKLKNSRNHNTNKCPDNELDGSGNSDGYTELETSDVDACLWEDSHGLKGGTQYICMKEEPGNMNHDSQKVRKRKEKAEAIGFPLNQLQTK